MKEKVETKVLYNNNKKEWLRQRNYMKARGQDKIKANNQKRTAEKNWDSLSKARGQIK